MFHTMCWLSGYGWGKLGEVKLPYNPVISTLSETRRRENRTNAQQPLGKIRCDGSSFRDYFAHKNANWNSPGHADFVGPRYFALDQFSLGDLRVNEPSSMAVWHLSKQSETGTWSVCHHSPPPWVTEIFKTNKCRNNLYSFFHSFNSFSFCFITSALRLGNGTLQLFSNNYLNTGRKDMSLGYLN